MKNSSIFVAVSQLVNTLIIISVILRLVLSKKHWRILHKFF